MAAVSCAWMPVTKDFQINIRKPPKLLEIEYIFDIISIEFIFWGIDELVLGLDIDLWKRPNERKKVQDGKLHG